jgi:predicted PurR-regulated permease PerM
MSAFSLNEFYRRNRRVVIWVILFGLLWLLRDFFGLVFLTFVLAFAAAPLVEFGHQRLHLPHLAALAGVYLLFLVTIATFVRFVVPDVASEANRLIGNLPQIEQRLVETKNNIVLEYPSLRQPINGFLRSALDDEIVVQLERELAIERANLGISEEMATHVQESAEPPVGNLVPYLRKQDELLVSALMTEQFQHIRERVPAAIDMVYRGIATLLLALLFSFLLLIDLGRIKNGVQRLRNSRVGDFYEEAALPVVRFGMLVGRAIEAQAMIAVVNTLLTLVGLIVLQIPLVAMLSMIIFVCSFIPVLGVFISTTPIVLVALNAGGLGLSLGVVVLITIIHIVEAYMLNPLIYGRHLKLNPVLTLIILYMGYHVFGLWGMLLGVPVVRYIIHDLLGVPFRDAVNKREPPLPRV